MGKQGGTATYKYNNISKMIDLDFCHIAQIWPVFVS